ncbi:MAG: SIMPL domain-containing protein [Candidatus Liptonbacteria bacterium]|nr:SIMPL domain-containing protein [Candidatus Liptonbacteria bacterium]
MENTQYKNYFWLLLDVLIVAIILNLVFFVMPTIRKFGDSIVPARVLNVTAEGKTTVSPDIAEISFSVVSQGVNPESLASANNDKMNAVIENIKANGIDAKDIKTTSYDLQPNYSYDRSSGRSYIYGYSLTQTVFVKVRDLTKVAKVIAGVTPLGVNQIGGVSFRVDDPEKFLAEARADAFRKAKEKAEKIASANGAKLGEVVAVSGYQNGPIPYYAKTALGVGGAADSVPVVPSIEPGTQELTVNISVTYSLR